MKTLIKAILFTLLVTAKIFAMEGVDSSFTRDPEELRPSLHHIQRATSDQSVASSDALTPGTIEKLVSPPGYKPFGQVRSPRVKGNVMKILRESKSSRKVKRDTCLLDSITRITASTNKNFQKISRKDLLKLKRYYSDNPGIQGQIDDFVAQFEAFKLMTKDMNLACKRLTKAISAANSSGAPRSGYEDEESALDEDEDR